MAKRKKNDPELPLFDLPLRQDDDGVTDDGYDDGLTEDLQEVDAPLDLDDSLESSDGGLATPVQTMLPDVVVEPPVRERVEMTSENGRDAAATPRARLGGEASETSLFDAPEDEPFDDDVEYALAAPLGERALAGLADLGINLLMLAIAALACHFVGIEMSLDLWPPFVGLSLVLSFLYWIIPLAFWGQTPGMAWLGNIARSFDDEPLSFGQALLRWLGAWITAGLLGLPQLLALGGRSLSDRLSDSKTLVLPDDPDIYADNG